MSPQFRILAASFFLAVLIAAPPLRGADHLAEIPLWPDGEVPLPAANRELDKPGPETIEQRGDRERSNRWVTGTRIPSITSVLPEEEVRNGTAVVICPGGGYSGLAFDKEGIHVGQWFAERGVAAFVLKYRHGGGSHRHPVPLLDVQRAICTVRARSEEWQLNAQRIGVCGFSAGGHLAASASTLFDNGNLASSDKIEQQSSRPDFAVLIYPVISSSGLRRGRRTESQDHSQGMSF